LQTPHPTLSISTPNLTLSSTTGEGSFVIKNTGTGELTGRILSRYPGLTFTPTKWTGNSQTITYSLAPQNSNSTIETVAYITSNGGEIALPVTINTAPMTIHTDEGIGVTSIQDFYQYAQAHPASARRLFTSSEFYMLLLATRYPYIEAYESLHKDPNRERAMDNFFVLSKLKQKTTITFQLPCIHVAQKWAEKSLTTIRVRKSDSGYADAPVTTEGGAPWLSISTERLTSFDENNIASIAAIIDPALMPGVFVSERIHVGDASCEITAAKTAPIVITLPRAGYRYEDRGVIRVVNNTGANITVDMYSPDRFIRFYAGSYTVETSYDIPFEIRPTAFQSAQRLFRRWPYVSTSINVRAHTIGFATQKRLHLTIGEW